MIALIALGAVRLAFPSDVPFINDEALIVAAALDANERGAVVSAGLVGTRGAQYGPLPTWLYQAGLSLTPDLRWIAIGKILLVTTLTGLALVRLAPALRVPPILGAFAFLSPYLWFYARDLWDNSFTIPLSALVLAFYAEFLRGGGGGEAPEGRGGSEARRAGGPADGNAEVGRATRGEVGALAVAAVAGTLGIMTHFMIAPLVLAVALHFATTHWRRLGSEPRFAASVAAIVAVCVVLALPYLLQVSGGSLTSFLVTPSVRSLGFAVDGMRTFTVRGFDYVIGPWSAGGLGGVVVAVTCLSYLVGAYGFAVCLARQRQVDPTADRRIAEVLVLALVLFVLVANGKRLAEHPHYYSGIWTVFFAVWWIGMGALWERKWARVAFVAQSGVMVAFLLGVAGWLHVNGGSRALHYGPTLGNQMEVARALEERGVEGIPPSSAHHPRLFPHALATLRRLERARAGDFRMPSARSDAFEIVYPEPESSRGEIALRERVGGEGR